MRALPLVLLLAACASGGPQTIYPGQYVAEHGPSALSRAPRTLVEVRPIREVANQEAGEIGNTRDEKGAVVATMRLFPPPGRQFTDAFSAELEAAGHKVVGAGAPAVLEGAVQRFSFAATPDKLSWDSRVAIAVAVTLRVRGKEVNRNYTAVCNDAGVMRPSGEAASPVVTTCIANIVHQFRDDPAVGSALAGQ